MKIDVLYTNGATETITTESLTEAAGITDNNDKKSIMSKFYINWEEFVNPKLPSNLNIYIYYYQKHSVKNSHITNKDYLDHILFYEADVPSMINMTEDQIKQQGKSLPYGSLEPGSWFTLIPLMYSKRLLQVSVDKKIYMYRSSLLNELIPLARFYFIEELKGWLDTDIKSLDERLKSFVNHAANDETAEIDEIIKLAGLPLSVKSLIEYKKEEDEDTNTAAQSRICCNGNKRQTCPFVQSVHLLDQLGCVKCLKDSLSDPQLASSQSCSRILGNVSDVSQ